MTRIRAAALALLLFISLASCANKTATGETSASEYNPQTIAGTICEGVGESGQTSAGSNGAPILILDERHDSRAVQIEQAIMLVRLHDRYGLKHIGLEGYCKEDPEIKTDWFTAAAKGLDEKGRARIAVRLLKEGDISSAEFMKLVYDDVAVHPIETRAEYPRLISDESTAGPMIYLLRIAMGSLGEDDVPALQQFQTDIKRLEAAGKTEAQNRKTKEMYDYILASDDWVKEKADMLRDESPDKVVTCEETLDTLKEIKSRAEENSIDVEPEDEAAMDEYIAFFQARADASKTMVMAMSKIADLDAKSVVAVIIGAAHTKGMCSLLSTAGRPYAVVSPLSLGKASGVPGEMMDRRYKRLTIYSQGFKQIISDACPSSSMIHPPPSMTEAWLQADVEVRACTERIVDQILGPPTPPGGGKPPFGFPDDEFKGRWVFVDPKRITVAFDGDDGQGHRVVLFPVILNPDDPARRTEMWIKAGRGQADVSGRERKTVEQMLKDAMEELKSEKSLGKNVEDVRGRIQITLGTVAAVGRTKEAVQKVKLDI